MYVATINVPGYLPMDDEPPTFETAQEAWEYLADEREWGEMDFTYTDAGVDGCNGEYACALSPVLHELLDEAARASDPERDSTGTIYGDTPGYDGEHDLGLAYSVALVEEDEGCTPETGHLSGSDHRWQECPTYDDGRF